MSVCCKRGEELNSAYDPQEFAVDQREALEYRGAGLRVGDLVCTVCMHDIMFPTLFKSRDLEDIADAPLDAFLEW